MTIAEDCGTDSAPYAFRYAAAFPTNDWEDDECDAYDADEMEALAQKPSAADVLALNDGDETTPTPMNESDPACDDEKG